MACPAINQSIGGHSENCLEGCPVDPQEVQQFEGPVLPVGIDHFHQNGFYLSVGKLHLSTSMRMVRGGHFVFYSVLS